MPFLKLQVKKDVYMPVLDAAMLPYLALVLAALVAVVIVLMLCVWLYRRRRSVQRPKHTTKPITKPLAVQYARRNSDFTVPVPTETIRLNKLHVDNLDRDDDSLPD
jgi:hypothetical protein